MKRYIITLKIQSIVFLSIILIIPLIAGTTVTPAKLVSAFIVKLASFEKNLSSSPGDITIYVMGAPEVAKELKTGIGKSIGKATLKNVISGDKLPDTKPSIFYIGDESKVDEVKNYCRSNKVLSVTGLPDLVAKGITLGVGIGEDGKPRILLNISSSVEEGLDWNPAILKVATTIK